MANYLDTSALVKLVVVEAESAALRAWLAVADRLPASAELARTELIRAVRRTAPDRAQEARDVLDSVALLTIDRRSWDTAGLLEPAALHSLDALHLAAALSLGDDLDGIVTYDARMADAARAHGIPVIAPA